MFEIRLRNDVKFLCEQDVTLLDAALKSGIFLNHSCKRARCNSCKARVLEGEIVNNINDNVLSKEDKLQGYILTCNAIPITNLKLDVEDLSDYSLNKKIILPSKIVSFKKCSKSTKKVTLRLPPNNNFNFLPGQYVNIIRGSLKRSYSIANSSKINDKLDFYIKEYKNGLMSHYWFKEAKKDDLLRIEGPLGTFFLRHNVSDKIIFLATGTGIAPIKAILEQMEAEKEQFDTKDIFLFWGNRFKDDLFEDFNYNLKKFNFVPILSKPNKEWQGEIGYVQDILIKKIKNFENTQIYACGSDEMITIAKKTLLNLGLPENNFHSDAFVCSN